MPAASRRLVTEAIFELEQRELDLMCADVDKHLSHSGQTSAIVVSIT